MVFANYMLLVHHIYKQQIPYFKLMVINKNTKGISYDAMMKSKSLNSFIDDSSSDDSGTSDEEE